MGQYKSQYTGPQIDAGINAALNPDVTVTPDSDALVTSGAVADALDNIDPTITSNTDTTLNGILVGDSGKVGTKSLDTSSLTNDADHVPVSSVVKSALDNKADNSAIGIEEAGNTATHAITAGQYVMWKGFPYTADVNIAIGATLASSGGSKNLTAVNNGGLNDLLSVLGAASTESLATGVTILRIGKLRVIHCVGAQIKYDVAISSGDTPTDIPTTVCYVTDSSYFSIRLGRLFIENGVLKARQLSTYNSPSISITVLNTGDRVYGEIVYVVS